MGKEPSSTDTTSNSFLGKISNFLTRNCRRYPILSSILAFLLLIPFLFALLDASVRLGGWTHIPSKQELKEHDYDSASEIYSIDGKLFGKFYFKDRSLIPSSYIPLHLKEALIATEDARYYSHNGVDERSLFRVLFKSLLGGDASSGGGSTLSQQLAKQWYPREQFSFSSLLINKLKEMEIARRLEKVYTKEEIITHYLNTVFLGDQSYGLSSASQRYFSKTCDQLKMEEACTLIGMLKAPTTYNPRTHPHQARQRRNVVIRQMQKYAYITGQQADSLVDLPLTLDYQRGSHHEGLAPYFRSYLRQFLTQWVQDNPKADGSHWNIYQDGLKIFTPIHSKLQAYAEQAVKEEMKKIQKNFDRELIGRRKRKLGKSIFEDKKSSSLHYKRWKEAGYSEEKIDSLFRVKIPMQIFSYEGTLDTLMSPYDSLVYSHFLLQPAFCAMEPNSGYIRAWVGGLDHRHFQFDHVLAHRQAGSAFKPLVYATALEEGIDPCDFTPNEQTTYARFGNWRPSNSDRLYGGQYSMQGALTHSVNVVAVKIVMEIGEKSVCDMAKDMGIPYDLPQVPSIALGSAEIALQDLMGIYCTIANDGKRVRPKPVVRIESREGDILYDATQQFAQRQVLETSNAQVLLHMMKSVIDKGTGKGLRQKYRLKLDMAGKTGTTQKQTDGWFVGLTPNLAGGAWVGADDQRVHFRTMAGQGARTALPIYGRFMQLMLADKEFSVYKKSRFPKLSAANQARLDCPAFTFPINMEDFREWWYSKYGKEDSAYFDGMMQGPTPLNNFNQQ